MLAHEPAHRGTPRARSAACNLWAPLPSRAERRREAAGCDRARARALAGSHRLRRGIAALDVSVQASILNLLADLRDDLGVAYLFISHDIAVVAHIADRIAVMYRGTIVEEGPASAVLAPPHHPYTAALLQSVPVVDLPRQPPSRAVAENPSPAEFGPGCVFRHRCPIAIAGSCDRDSPPVQALRDGHRILCHAPLGDLYRIAPANGWAAWSDAAAQSPDPNCINPFE